MVKGSSEVITKSEAARRWGVSPAAVAKYIGKGMPVRPDGLLDWPAVDAFRNRYNVPGRSGNYRSRLESQDSATEKSDPTHVDPSEEFSRGSAWAALQLCSGARRAWPEFVSGLSFEMVPPDQRTATKGLITAAMLYLVESWVQDHVDLRMLPPINWHAFGSDASAISRECEALMDEWRDMRRVT